MASSTDLVIENQLEDGSIHFTINIRELIDVERVQEDMPASEVKPHKRRKMNVSSSMYIYNHASMASYKLRSFKAQSLEIKYQKTSANLHKPIVHAVTTV